MSQFPYHITGTVEDGGTITAFIDGIPYMTDRSNPHVERIVAMLNDPDTTSDQLINAIKPIGAVSTALHGVVNVEVAGGNVLVDGEAISSTLADRVLDIAAAGLAIEPWVQFVQNVFANPFVEAREEFYDWMASADMPITSDGGFLAYKIVGENYRDIYSGQFDNHVGQVVSMPRELVDANRRQACSAGLHFCSKGYLPCYGTGPGSHVMLIKVNPADVVSIPYGDVSKGRTWRYEVVGEINRDLAGIKSWLPIDATWDSPTDDPTGTGEDKATPVKVAAKHATKSITTDHYGELSFGRFAQMRANNGDTNAGLARALDLPVGTVGGWARSFRAKGCPA